MKLKKIKNALFVVLTLALVAAASVAITWALTKNDITALDNLLDNAKLETEISESKWDGTKGTVETGTAPTGNDLGQNIADKYTLSTGNIPKNPSITNPNTTGNADEYVAMKAVFKVKLSVGGTRDSEWREMTMDQFTTAFATIKKEDGTKGDTNGTAGLNDGWSTADVTKGTKTATVFYYGNATTPAFTKLAKGAMTSKPVFDYVQIDPTKIVLQSEGTYAGKYKIDNVFTSETGDYLYMDDLPDFDIVLTGFAVQADNITANDAKTALDNMIKETM